MQEEFLLTAILLLTVTALCAGAALVLSLLHLKAQKPGQGDHLEAKLLDGLLRDHPIEREFNKVFMTTSKEGKRAPIKTDRKKCDRIRANTNPTHRPGKGYRLAKMAAEQRESFSPQGRRRITTPPLAMNAAMAKKAAASKSTTCEFAPQPTEATMGTQKLNVLASQARRLHLIRRA